ncbi:hypothetical protein F4604DRAFT_1684643 [Suillus subluteus]|nr:hypothetical protein F4604DRAFT_1684643 [Suillus subluteus]
MSGKVLKTGCYCSNPMNCHLFHEDFTIWMAITQPNVWMVRVEWFCNDVHNWPGENPTGTNNTCTERWTAAKSVEEDKISVFEQTGIFILACQHGFVECIMEMKCSGDLVKYGLAVINQLLEVYGQDQGLGHDIGCPSRKTIAASSIGNLTTDLNLIVAVNTFHGYAHNHWCQLHHHPLYLQGFSNEDLETYLHFDQWDQDKYIELSRFLYDNYVQALGIIEENMTKDHFIRWQQEESDFLSNLAEEPPTDAITATYVEELEKLRVAESTYGSLTSLSYLTYTPASFTPSSSLNTSARQQSKAAEAQYQSALQQYQLQMNVVEDFEQRHGITECWTPTHHEYAPALQYSCQLEAWVEYDEGKMLEVIKMLVADDPSSLLAAEFNKQHSIRQLKGYSGLFSITQQDFAEMEGQDDEGSGDPEENDELSDEALHLEDTISHI